MQDKLNQEKFESPPIFPNENNKRSRVVRIDRLKQTTCNLCGKEFKLKNKYERFCEDCKLENQDYHDYEIYDVI